jgi:hypothetical protein
MLDPRSSVSRTSPPVESEHTLVADPLADLLLSTVAIVVLAMIAILPTLPHHSTPQGHPTSSVAGDPENGSFRLEDRAVEPLVATERGLIIWSQVPREIPIDRIFFDESLVARLKRMRSMDDTLVLLIEPNGSEAAFQFEVIANLHGPKKMRQVRLYSECGHAKSEPLPSYCGELARWAQGRHP